MPYLTVNGNRTHYQQQGSGPDVVLIHAFTSNLAIWIMTRILGELARDFRVTLYDLRGHGASEIPKSGYTSNVLATDLAELMRQLDIAPAYCVGHSYGGVIGVHTAVDYPDMVRGTILCDTYFPGLASIEPEMKRAGVWIDLQRTLAAVGAEVGDEVNFTELFAVIDALPPEAFQALEKQMGAGGVRWLEQSRQLTRTTAGDEMFEVAGLTAERIASTKQPVVALYDEHTPFHATRDFLAHELDDCTVDVVLGANHLAPLQNAPALVKAIGKHLRRMAGIAPATDDDALPGDKTSGDTTSSDKAPVAAP